MSPPLTLGMTINQKLYDEMEEIRHELHKNRSEYIREAIRRYNNYNKKKQAKKGKK